MSDPLIMQRRDGESDEDFAARFAESLQQAPAPSDQGDEEQF